MENTLQKPNNSNSTVNIFNGIKTLWPIVISLLGAIVTGVVMWTTLSTKTDANSERISNIESAQIEITKTLTSLQVSTGRLEASVGGIQNDTAFIKARLR